ncbi:MAG: lipase [Mycobacteriaceae bacterium]|nr:lipase [Mycobacteriaceae bacterium]
MRSVAVAAIMMVAAMTGSGGQAAAAPAASAGAPVSVGPLAARATPPGAVHSKRIVYRTSGIAGAPASSGAAVYFPPGRPPAAGWPVLAWAHGTLGLADRCAYSVNGPAERDRDWAYLSTWLRHGYAVVATDYVGLGTPGRHPYLNGLVEAHNIVDAVKAAGRLFPGTLARRWVAVGQSQGAGAAMAAARHATVFGGAELEYLGAVATGLPAHVEDLLPLLGPGVPPVPLSSHLTEYVLYIMSGLRASRPDLDIDSYLSAAGRRWVDHAETSCAADLADQLAARRVAAGSFFVKPVAALPNAHALLFDYLGVAESGYDRPLFVGQGLTDTDVPMPGTLASVAALQANRQPVTFRSYPTDHNGTVNASLVDSLPFVRGLFESRPTG